MKKFFIDTSEGSVKVGLDCMTLLQYRRYRSFSAAKVILDDNSTENAFLKYAAAFWFLHFMDTEHHSEESFEEVRKFMGSPNFWTCVALQSYVVPYNFGRYARTGPKKYQMGVRRADWSEGDCFAVPLPNWLGQYAYGKQLDHDFCSFVSDWHEVLASRPGTLDQCVPLSTMQSKIGEHLHQSDRIKVWKLNEKMDLENFSQLRVMSISLSRGKLFAELVCKSRSDPPGRLHYHRISVFSKGTKVHGSYDTRIQSTDLESLDTDFQLVHNDSQARVMKFDGSHLQLVRSIDGLSQTFSPPSTWKATVPNQTWGIKWKSDCLVLHGKLDIFHVVRDASRSAKETHDDTESSDSDSDSSSESESDSDSITDSHYDSGYEEGSTSRTRSRALDNAPEQCVIIVWETSPPLWIPITPNKGLRQGIPFAVHPSLPIVVLGDLNGHMITANMHSGTWHIEDDPRRMEDDKSLTIWQDLRFSPCGQFLFSLQACFQEEENHAECKVSLSTGRFTANEGNKNSLDELRIHRPITYKIKESLDSLPSELVIAHWSDSEVVIALPPLTCEPKIVKFGLPQIPDVGPDPSLHVETLQTPIYFPSSAIVSSPLLLYRHRSSSKDHELFLALTQKKSVSNSTNYGKQAPSVTSSPIVIRWKIPHEDGWRVWDPNVDEESEDLKRGVDEARILRGGFVDGDKRFYVPIRSGLDWTRTAYLTCC